MRPNERARTPLIVALLIGLYPCAGHFVPALASVQAGSSQPATTPPAASPEFDIISKQANDAREAGRVAEAIPLYQQALALRANWDEGWWYLGTLLYSVDRYSDALDSFRHLILTRPEKGATWAMVGLCEIELRKYERALEDLEKARALGLGEDQTLSTVARYNDAILLNRFEKFEVAYQVLHQFAVEPNDDTSIIEAMGINALRMPFLPSEVPPDKHELVMMTGRAAFAMAARNEDGDKLFRELLARYPDAPNVHYAYGFFLTGEHPDEAIAQFRREIEISPSHVASRLQIAFEYIRRDDPSDALPYAEEAVRIEPNSAHGRYLLGRALLETGETQRAIEELERSLKLAPESAEVHFALSRAYARAGRKKDAARERAEFSRLDSLQRAESEGPQAVGGLKRNSEQTSPK
jgi:tetratricopeptide (TPR) repeat protein